MYCGTSKRSQIPTCGNLQNVSTNFMNNLRKIFQTENLDRIPDHFWNDNKKICYYPSSGYDFRHIFYWDFYCEKQNIEFPEIFIHSDFTCLDWNPYPKEHMGISRFFYEKLEKEGKQLPHPLLYNGYILDVFGNGNSVVIKNWTEIFLKNDVFYPNRDLFYFADQIKERTHKVFAIQCQLINIERDVYSLTNGDTIKSLSGRMHKVINPKDRQNHNKMRVADEEGKESNYDFNSFIYPTAKQFIILLFTMENSNFFFDVLLENKIKIDFLTHINDGGASMGGSKTRMDFIYLYSETLGLSNMIIDYKLKEKQRNFSKWEHHYYFNPKVKREPFIRKRAELNIEDWNESKVFFPDSTGIYIKGKWDTGHHNWNYSDFDELPVNMNEAHENQMRIRKNGYYVDEYYHYKRQ